MKGMGTFRKSVLVFAVCLAVLCLPGYSEPTPEQVKERTQLLCEAINSNNVEQAKVCIKLGADVNAEVYNVRDSDWKYYITTKKPYSDYFVYTPLTYAVEHNKSKDIVELLIKAGADVNAKRYIMNSFSTVLMLAASYGRIDIAELLIKAGADVNAENNTGSTALRVAAIEGYKDIVELLIKAGVNPNAKDSDGISVLDYAILHGRNDIADLLRAAGAKE